MSNIESLSNAPTTADNISQTGIPAEELKGNAGGVSIEPANAPEENLIKTSPLPRHSLETDALELFKLIRDGTENDAKDAVLKLATLIDTLPPEIIQSLLNDTLLKVEGYTNGDPTPYLQKLSAEEGPIDSIIKYSEAHQHQSLTTPLTLIKKDYQRQLETLNNLKTADDPVLNDGLDGVVHDINMSSSRGLKDSAQETAFILFETLSLKHENVTDAKNHITKLADLSNNLSQETLEHVLKDAIRGNVNTSEDTIELAIREIRGLISTENESLGFEKLLKTLAPLKYTLSQITNNDAGEITTGDHINDLETLFDKLDSSFSQAVTNLIIDVFSQVIDAPDIQVNKLTSESFKQMVTEIAESILSEALKSASNVDSPNLENSLNNISEESVREKINSYLKELHEKAAPLDDELHAATKQDIKSWLNDLKTENEIVDAEAPLSVSDIENGLVEMDDHLDEIKETDGGDETVDTSSPTSTASEHTEQAHEPSANEQHHPHPGLVKSTLNTIGSFFSLLFAMLSGWARNEPGEGRLISQARHMSTAWNAFIASMSGIGSSIFGEKGKE